MTSSLRLVSSRCSRGVHLQQSELNCWPLQILHQNFHVHDSKYAVDVVDIHATEFYRTFTLIACHLIAWQNYASDWSSDCINSSGNVNGVNGMTDGSA